MRCDSPSNSPLNHAPNAWALIPLLVFLLTYLVVSILAGDFYKMPITVAFVISSVVAIAISKGGKLSNRIEHGSAYNHSEHQGIGHSRLIGNTYCHWGKGNNCTYGGPD